MERSVSRWWNDVPQGTIDLFGAKIKEKRRHLLSTARDEV